MNITFYNDVIDPRIPEMQRNVFETLGLTIQQVKPHKWEGHGGTIDGWLRGKDQENSDEVIILWDIDCIPLNTDVIGLAVQYAESGGIFGIAQKASHIPNSIIYAGPAFLAFSMKTWRELGRPTFGCTDRSDCAGELTHAAIEKEYGIRLLYPTHVEEPLWDLNEDMKFGKGTTFSNSIYHAFLSRKGNESMFLDKCSEVLSKIEREC